MNDSQKIFNLFIEKFYHIVPNRIDAKILFSIFLEQEKEGVRSYSEIEFKQLIKYYSKQENSTEREQRQKTEERLQSFLRYNYIERTKDRTLVLSDYSQKLCSLFFEKIQPMLNPSEIEVILDNACLTLEKNAKEVKLLNTWYNTQFNAILKSKIDAQLKAIEFHITDLQNEFNERYKNEEISQLIDPFTTRMEFVIENRKKLTKAFEGLYKITDILNNSHLKDISNIEFINIKTNLTEAFDHYQYKLEELEKRITQIKSTVYGVIDRIDSKPLNRRLENFLLTILRDSTSEKKGNRKDNDDDLYYSYEIKLPGYLSNIEQLKEGSNYFLYPEVHDSFSSSRQQHVDAPERNSENIRRAAEKSRKRQENAKKITHWYSEVKEEVLLKGEVDFSNYYFRYLDEEKDLEIAIKGMEHILTRLRKLNFIISTSQDFTFYQDNRNNSIWRVIIKKPV